MTRFASRLTRNTVLWALFGLVLLLTVAFAVVMRIHDFTIIDEMWEPEAIRAHVEAMSATQRGAHAWLTGTVDVAYPFAYAALFAGLALRHLGRAGPWVALLSAAIIPVDLVEGFAQVMILNGEWTWLGIKAIATPLKLALFIPALCLAVLAVVLGTVGGTRRKLSG